MHNLLESKLLVNLDKSCLQDLNIFVNLNSPFIVLKTLQRKEDRYVMTLLRRNTLFLSALSPKPHLQ